jgi:hypothetical protein
MWNTVSVLVRYSSQCSTFNKHIRSSSMCTQMLGIGTYKWLSLKTNTKHAIFDVFINGIIFAHVHALFYDFPTMSSVLALVYV